MVSIVTTISRFTLLIWAGIYMLDSFGLMKRNIRPRRENYLYYKQRITILIFMINAGFVLFLNTQDITYLILMVCEFAFFQVLFFIYTKLYRGIERTLVNHMAFLLCVGFVIQSRLSTKTAIRQFIIASVSLVITAFIPLIIRSIDDFSRFELLYGVLGIGLLASVFVLGSTEYGAKLSLNFGVVSIQPTEFVKLLFVLFLSSGLYEASQSNNSERIFRIVLIVALIHIGILVLCKDLGSASILFVVLLIMTYYYKRDIRILLVGFLSVSAFLVLSYFVFSHVHSRVLAWLDPMSVIDHQGYQVAQSLFALGTGGWFGSGLFQGMPNKIPVVTKDFVFAAIGEEFGGIFAIILIFIYLACILMMMNTAMLVRDEFPRYIAIGFAVCFGFQVFLSIGGVVKFIPSTGVTMQFISYGGSSLLSTMMMFSIFQGITIRRSREEEAL